MIEYSDDCPQIIKDFLNYCFLSKNLSPLTIRQYYFDLMKYVKYFALFKPVNFDITEIKRITSQDLFNYLFTTTKELKANSRARKVTSLKSFYKWMYVKEKLLDENISETLDIPKIGKTQPLFLTVAEQEKLLSVVDGDFKERDTAILYTLLLTGVRLAELCSIDINHIKEGVLKITGKGNKQRYIPLSNTVIEVINTYVKVRIIPKIEKDALFVSKMKNRISHRMVEKIVNQYVIKAGLDNKISPHKLRHSFGTTSYQYGNHDIRALQELMGHTSISTTELYTHNNKKQLKNVIDSNPLNKPINKPKN
jgi:site-specific recombinase XerD